MRFLRRAGKRQKLEGIEFKQGDVLGQRYLVLDVRRGFMGIVYIARDLQRDEVVALKTFQRKFTWVPEAIENFNREAEVWMRLGWHPNIVQAKRLLTVAGRPHIVMEYVNGQSLRHLAKILPIPKIFDVTIHICWAMQYAYERCAIVHRDLKPDNVLITSNDIAKVTDFGLAQAVSWAQSQQRSAGSETLLRRQARELFRGSQPYMSPEQRLGDGLLGPWSDIYSLGVMLFELLTGRLPFYAHTAAELTRLHLEEPPPNPRHLVPELPRGTEYVVLRCLEKGIEQRYRSFAELERDLQGLRAHHFGERLALPPEVTNVNQALEAHGRGMAHLSLGEHHTARRWFRAAIDLEPRHAEFWLQLGIAEMRLMQYEEALFCLSQAEEHALSPDEQLSVWQLRGEVHEHLFQYTEALNAYRNLLRLNRRYHQGWAGLARVLGKLSRYREAYEACNEACRLDPSDPDLLVARGLIEHALGQRKQAVHSYNDALKLNPRDVAAWCGKAICLVEMKRYEEALACYKTAVDIDEDSAEAQSGVIECKRVLGYDTKES